MRKTLLREGIAKTRGDISIVFGDPEFSLLSSTQASSERSVCLSTGCVRHLEKR